VLGWTFPSIFSPVHVIFLELIMGPTCSVVYENEPLEKNAMFIPPRPFSESIFSLRELTTSIVQGLAITAGVLGVYQYAVLSGGEENTVRSMAFLTLISANIFLTLGNRSFYYSMVTTLGYTNKMLTYILGITLAMTVILFTVGSITEFFELRMLHPSELAIAISAGFVSVAWYELVKLYHRRRNPAKLLEHPDIP
jgi:P-type Ca2+ transporter type 2C